jgi:hypothetical protein
MCYDVLWLGYINAIKLVRLPHCIIYYNVGYVWYDVIVTTCNNQHCFPPSLESRIAHQKLWEETIQHAPWSLNHGLDLAFTQQEQFHEFNPLTILIMFYHI